MKSLMPLFKKTLYLSLIIFLQSGAVILGSAAALDKGSGLIQQGFSINGIPVGGLSPVEAAQILEDGFPSPAGNAFLIEDGEKSYTMELSGIDARYDYMFSAIEALDCSVKDKYVNQLISVLRLRAKPVDKSLKFAYSESAVADKIKNLQAEWDQSPVNAAIVMSDNNVVIVPEKNGYTLDFEKTLEQALDVLSGGGLQVSAAGRVIKPDVTAGDLTGIDLLLAEYTTHFDGSAVNRTHNIALASATVNGCLLRPGETFSLNERLGPRLAETGYLEAPVFFGNQLGLDVGGGICQVATTIYDAVILADLPVLERYPHPLPVSYSAPGLDATIAEDSLDLKFANNLDTPVYISSMVENGQLTVRIFGAVKENGKKVRITTENFTIDPAEVVIHDDSLPESESIVISEGKPGYEVRVYKEIIVDDVVTSKTMISSDYLKPENKVVRVGPVPKENNK